MSLESVLAASDSTKMAQTVARQLDGQIEENERQLATVGGFSRSLYENMASGLITKEDFKSLKTKYTADEARLRGAIAALEAERAAALDGSAERLRWMEHFRQFEGLAALDRRAVVNLIRSIRVLGKAELEISFTYQDEYAQAQGLLGREAA